MRKKLFAFVIVMLIIVFLFSACIKKDQNDTISSGDNETIDSGDNNELNSGDNGDIGSGEIVNSGDEGNNNEDDEDEIVEEIPSKVLMPTYYYEYGSQNDVVIPLVNTSGVANIDMFDLIIDGMYEYNAETNSLIINQIYLRRFSAGFKTKVDITYNDNTTDSTYLEIVNTMPLAPADSNNGLYIYSKLDTLGLIVKLTDDNNQPVSLSVKAICVDGIKITSTKYTVSSKNSYVFFNNPYLKSLSGLHLFEIYTSWGRTEFYVYVESSKVNASLYPYNVVVDFDSSYPDVFVTWQIDNEDIDNFNVVINDTIYNSLSDKNLFDGNKFNATGLIGYGDSVYVQAVYNNKKYDSNSTGLYVDIYDSTISSYLSYDRHFDFLGVSNNYYISDFDELKDYIFYYLIYYNDFDNSQNTTYEKQSEIYVDQNFCLSQSQLSSSVNSASLYLNEAVKGDFVVKEGAEQGEYTIYASIDSTCIPDENIRTATVKKNAFNDVHYSKVGRSEDYDDFAINNAELSAVVYYSEELYLAVERGVRPVPVEGTNAYTIYEKAKEVLRHIIDDNMSDYQKVHAIYDWVANKAVYDDALADAINSTKPSDPEYDKFYSVRSLFLEGVFLDGVAVCNGYAKAISLLCGIEGIPCYKIKGGSGGSAYYGYPQHAWNKVYVGGEWYVMDSTWAAKEVTYAGKTVEVLKHNLMFMSEEKSGNYSGGAHYEQYSGDYTGKYAGDNYNYFANTFFTYDSNLYDYIIDDAEELNIIIEYYKQEYGIKMTSGQFIYIDLGITSNNLSKFLNQLDNSIIKSYKFEVTSWSGADFATLIITKS